MLRDCTLVCVGATPDGVIPDAIKSLERSAGFGALVHLPQLPDQSERYWLEVLTQLPPSVGRTLVVPAQAIVSEDILRLGTLLDHSTAAVFPLGRAYEVSRPFMPDGEEIALSVADINIWLNRYALGRPLELPAFSGYVAWINCDAIPSSPDVPDDLCLADLIRRNGYSFLLSDEAYVDDSALPVAPTLSGAVPSVISSTLLTRHPYTGLRHPLSELNVQRAYPPKGLDRGPATLLHISHSWGGGLGRWISDFCSAEDQHNHLILKSVGNRDAGAQALALFIGSEPVPLKQWSLSTPIQSTSLGNHEYREVLSEIFAAFSVRGIIVSSLIGHSLDLYQTELPIIQVLHDYYPWCPPLYATWESPCEMCDADRLQSCLQNNPAHRFFRGERADWYIVLRERFVSLVGQANVSVVAPSNSVMRRWCQLAPGLSGLSVSTIGHGLPLRELQQFSEHRWEKPQLGRLNLLVLGMLSDHKGGRTLARIMPDLLERYDVTLLGTGEEAPVFKRDDRLTVIKWYQLHQLPPLLAEIKPDLGLLLSEVPETFSYTLSELFAAGIPAIASDLGAFSDRIQHGINGWLVKPGHSEALLRQLADLDTDRSLIALTRETLLKKVQRSASDMVDDYLALLPSLSPLKLKRSLSRSIVAEPAARLDQGEPSQKAIFIRPGASYRLALYQFLHYSYNKVHESPNLAHFLKKPLGWLMRLGMRLSRP